MSGLLVKTTIIMRENLEELNDAGPRRRCPVLLGGAALTRNYVERDLREVYDGRVFYGKDAFEGLRTMDTLMAGKRTGELDPDFGRDAGGRKPAAARRVEADARRPPVESRRAPTSPPTSPIFTPPFVGSRVAKGISLDDIAGYINETALFRNQWQFRPEKVDRRERRRLQGAHPPDAARAARRSPRPRAARARGGVGLLRR